MELKPLALDPAGHVVRSVPLISMKQSETPHVVSYAGVEQGVSARSFGRVRAAAPADIPMDRIADSSQLSEPQKIAEVSRQFEAVLLRQILTQAQKVHFHSKYNGDATTGGIYQDMATSQLADGISKSGGLGLADTLTLQLTRQLSTKAQEPT